jgi:predicted SnoaL-like aldol condensation-catalyzing enzyme
MGEEQNKAMVRLAVEEIFNKQNPDAVDKYHTADFINHDPSLPQVRSLEEYKQWIEAILTAYPLPGYRVITDDIIAEGDRVVMRWTCQSTGKEATFTGATVYRLVGDKIAECWWIYDMLGVLQQVGVIPTIGQT